MFIHQYMKFNHFRYFSRERIIFFFIGTLFFSLGFSPAFQSEAFAQKKSKSSKEKGGIGKAYHSFVSFFNGYYNANVLYKEGIYKMDKSAKVPEEDFLPLLPTIAGAGGQFDQVIEKCDIIIFKHKKGKWTDDAYFLKGRSEYFKGKYVESIVAFEYILQQYPKTDLRNDLNYWLARANYTTQNKYRANEYMEQVLSDKELPDKLKVQAAALKATMVIEEKDYEMAIKTLENALPLVKKKIERARWNYLLAQLYDAQKNEGKSKYHFDQVISLNANNDLTFRSRLNKLQLLIDYSNKGSIDYDEVATPLRKLAAEEKYKDFRDQIYYKLAKLEQKRGGTDASLTFFRQSIAANSGRVQLKTLAYYEVGQIYFYKKQQFDSAQAFFDSASVSVDPKSKDFYAIKSIAKTLKRYKIAKYTIREQDSLLKIAALPEGDQKKVVADYVEKEEKWKEEAKRKSEMEALQKRGEAQMELFNQNQTNANLMNNSKLFYFDNPTQVQQGKALFTKLWGVRKNEDDWRRATKDKSFASADEEDPTKAKISDDKDDPVNGVEARKKRYFERIPKTAEDKAKALDKIMNSIYEMGQLFAQKLNLPDSAVKYFRMLAERFPESDLVPKGLYACYTMYDEKKNFPRATDYKKLILEKYPKTIFAKLLKKEKIETENESVADFKIGYQSILGLFQAGDHNTVINFADVLIEGHIDNPEIGKVYYMKGFSYGAVGKQDSMRNIYQFLKKSFPDEAYTKTAIRTLEILDGKNKTDASKGNASANQTLGNPQPGSSIGNNTGPDSGASVEQSGMTDPNSPFKGFNPRKKGDPFYIILIIESGRIPKKELDILISDFNQKNYSANNLQASTFSYTDGQKSIKHLVSIRSYDSGNLANAYLTTILAEQTIASLLKYPQSDAFFISASNFREAYNNKRFNHYGIYFLSKKDELIKE